MSTSRKPRTLDQNSAFHARIGEWAGKSGQHATELKQLVKAHLGEFTDVPLPNDPLTDKLLAVFARVLLALGRPDLMSVLPATRSVRFYHTSAKWTKDRMRQAIETVDMLAGIQGHSLGPADNRGDV